MYTRILFTAAMALVLVWTAYAGGVTNIKSVYNTSSKKVMVSAFDNKSLAENGNNNWLKTSVVTGGGCYWFGDMWVPWADNARQFSSHNIRIEIYDGDPARGNHTATFFGIYQTGEEIRVITIPRDGSFPGQHWGDEYARRYFSATAPRVEGEWRSGGERNIHFYNKKDGSIGFRFEQYSPPPRDLVISGCR